MPVDSENMQRSLKNTILLENSSLRKEVSHLKIIISNIANILKLTFPKHKMRGVCV